MILPIVRYGDPILRKKGAPVGPLSEDHQRLITDMIETMRHAKGIGLAAQQIGRALQLAIVDITGTEKRPSKMWINNQEVDPLPYMPLILIDPILDPIKKKYTEGEGCLSFPDVYGEIPRASRIRVQTRTLDAGTLTFDAAGLLGRAIQHEFDHLQGILFIDRMDPAERKKYRPILDALREGTYVPQPDQDDES
ncbi:MAG: peptide deformylase [Verrucomicrobiia bacterium]